jgi:phospholipid/cholesterol/gamma-HCH transport system substrate-binding protein
MNKANNYFEIIVGTFVLVCAGFFFITSFSGSKNNISSDEYSLIAKFNNADGIANGSDVKISGVKIGAVSEQSLDSETFQAVIKLNISNDIKLPLDSSIKIASEGLLGSKYLAISPGGDEENLKNGEEITFTQSSINFEELLGKFIFSSEEKKDQKND